MFTMVRWSTVLILLGVHFTHEETPSSTTESLDFATRTSNVSNFNSTNEESTPEWRSNDSNEYARAGGKVYSVDLASLHKYRRNGIENIPENDYRRRYFLDFPERYQQYENDLYQREKNRYQDEIYPVQIQGCSHMMRDVSRFQDGGGNRNTGILQGWIGGGTRWRGKVDDKRYESSPFYVTTATAKIAPSYRNREIYGKYDSSSYDRHNMNIAGTNKLYDQEYNKGRDSTNQVEYSRNRDYADKNTYPWMSSPQQNQNNRVVYYEYNLDDRRPHQHHGMNRICGINSDYNCEPQWYNSGSRNPQKNRQNHFYSPSDDYSRTNSAYSSKSMPMYPESDTQFSGYFAEDSYRNRNGDGRRNDGQQGIGFGYVYSLDLANDRPKVENPSAALMSDLPYLRRGAEYKRSTMNQLNF